MTPEKFYERAAEIIREYLGDRTGEVYLTIGGHVHGDLSRESTPDWTIGVIVDLCGRRFHQHTTGNFVRSPHECLAIFRRDIIPAMCQFMSVSAVAEYDPISMGA